jgi:hypothetical protein
MNRFQRMSIAGCLAASGYVHADLYVRGYRALPVIGAAFLLQASVSFAVALLLVAGGPALLRWFAAALAGGALGGFVLSRTIGLFGFAGQGLRPAPQAVVSVLAEIQVLLLLAAPFAARWLDRDWADDVVITPALRRVGWRRR